MSKHKEALSDSEFIRYSRQIMLPDWGETGQLRLRDASVVIIGCGGLGNSVASYLAGAGVGTLRLIDDDVVELSNLPRQLAFDLDSIQNAKAFELANRLREQNSQCIIEPIVDRFNSDNSMHYLLDASLVIDCSDNFETRYLVNQHCVNKKLPLISGAVTGWQGQLLLVEPENSSAGCYQCVFSEADKTSGSCATRGVSGPMVGVIASYQANEALRYLLACPSDLANTLRLIDGATFTQQSLKRSRRQDCPACSQTINKE